MRLDTRGIDALARDLAIDLEPAISAGAMGIAAALQDVIAPYPPPPATSIYQRTGQDQQGWRIRAIPYGAVLENRVAHSIYLHGTPREKPGQTKVHQQNGWVNEDDAAEQIDPAPIMLRAIGDRLGGTG